MLNLDFTTLVLSCICFICFSIWLLIGRKRDKPRQRESFPIKTAIVLGAGGHCREMLTLLSSVDFGQKYHPVMFILAKDDNMAYEKLKASNIYMADRMSVKFISRSRKVGQSYITSILTTLISFLECVNFIKDFNCSLLLCNGPGTCVPPLIAAKLFCRHATIVYVESICRTQTLSMSGKIAYQLADYVLVQWPEMVIKYPRCKYLGRLV